MFYINLNALGNKSHPHLSSRLTRLSLPWHPYLCACKFYTSSRTECQGLSHHHVCVCHRLAVLVTLAALFTALWYFHSFRWESVKKTEQFSLTSSEICPPNVTQVPVKEKEKKNVEDKLWKALNYHLMTVWLSFWEQKGPGNQRKLCFLYCQNRGSTE